MATANAIIGMQLARLDRPDDALVRFERAQVILGSALPAGHPMLFGNLERIAMAHRDAGRPDRARVAMTSVLEGSIRAYGAEHPSVARAHGNLGLMHRELGDDALAVVQLERAVAIHESVQSRPTDRGEARLQLGELLWSMPDQRERATKVVRAAAEDLRAAGPASAQRLARAQELLELGAAPP